MGFGEIIFGAIGPVIEAAKYAANHAEKERLKAISRKLRIIYFTPDGTLSLLKRIVEGKEVTQYHVQELSRKLAETEPPVQEALATLAITFHEAGLNILIRDNELRDKIESGKRSIRREIRDHVLDPLVRGQSLDHGYVATLQANVEQLNAAIGDLEASLKP